MHKINNEKVLRPLIERFEALSHQSFNNGKRDHDLDDLFAELSRAKLAPGEKEFEPKNTSKFWSRCFSYKSSDHTCRIYLRVKIIKGQKGESTFTVETQFKKKPTKPKK